MILVQIPSLLGIQITTEWFCLEESCKIETASCNRKIRPLFLEMLSSNVAIFPNRLVLAETETILGGLLVEMSVLISCSLSMLT
jgi:hypothetical protein